MGVGGEIGGVAFQDDPFRRQGLQGFRAAPRAGPGQGTAAGQSEAEVHGPFCRFEAAGKAVPDASAMVCVLLLEQGQQAPDGFAAVQHHRFPGGAGHLQLGPQSFFLPGCGGHAGHGVQPDLANGRDPLMGQQAFQLQRGIPVPALRRQGMHPRRQPGAVYLPCRGQQPGPAARMHPRQEKPVDAGLAGQVDLFFQGPVVREQIQMDMSIEQVFRGHGWKHSTKAG